MWLTALAAICTAFNAWGFYARIPGTNIDPSRTVAERFAGSIQLTSLFYALSEVSGLIESHTDDVPLITAIPLQHGSNIDDGPGTIPGTDYGQHGKSRHVFMSFPPESETSMNSAEASSTILPRETPRDGKLYEGRMYTLFDHAAKPRARYQGKDADSYAIWVIIALFWVFIIARNIGDGNARNDGPRNPSRPSSDAVLQGLPDLLTQTVTEPIKKTAQTMTNCLEAINAAAVRYESLPLADLRASSDNLNQVGIGVDGIKEQIKELVELKKHTSSTLDVVHKEISNLQKENKLRGDHISNIQGQLLVIQSQSRPSEDFSTKIELVERLLGERLKRLESRLDSFDSAVPIMSIHQLDEKLKGNTSKLEKDLDRLQRDVHEKLRNMISMEVIQQRENKFKAHISSIEKDLDAIRDDLAMRLTKVDAKEVTHKPDTEAGTQISKLQTDIDDLRKEIEKHLNGVVSAGTVQQTDADMNLKADVSNLDRKLDKLRTDMQQRLSNITSMESVQKLDEKYEAGISSLKRDLGKSHKEIQQQLDNNGRSIKSAQKLGEKHSADVSNLDEGLDRLRKDMQEWFNNMPPMEQLDQQHKADISNIKKNVDSLHKEMQEQTSNMSSMEFVHQLNEKHTADISTLKNNFDRFQKDTQDRLDSTAASINFMRRPEEIVKADIYNLEMELKKLRADTHEGFRTVAAPIEAVQQLDNQLKAEVSNAEKKLNKLWHDMQDQLGGTASKEFVCQIDKKLRANISDLEKDLESFRNDIRERVKTLSSEGSRYRPEKHDAEISKLEEDVTKLRKDMQARIDKLQSTGAEYKLDKIEVDVSRLEKDVGELREDMEKRLKSAATTDTVNSLSMKISLLKDDIDNGQTKLDSSLQALKGDLVDKKTDIDFAKAEIKKLNASALIQPPITGPQVVQGREFRDLRTRVDSTKDELDSLKTKHIILERRFNPIFENFPRHGVRITAVEETVDGQQRVIKNHNTDINEMLSKLGLTSVVVKNFSRDAESAAAQSPKVEHEGSEKAVLGGQKGPLGKKDGKRPSSSASDTPGTLTSSRWASNDPVPPAITPDDHHRGGPSGKKRGGGR